MNSIASPLDDVRLKSGNEALKAYFLEAAGVNRSKAAEMLNHDKLQFATLFVLIPAIGALNLYAALSPQNRVAVTLCVNLMTKIRLAVEDDWPLPHGGELAHATLRWIITTGAGEDGHSDDFDQILDTSASLLLRIYKDSNCLQQIVDMIFKRNRVGRYAHDLIWAVFSAHNPQVLKLVAEYLRSPHKKDTELASKLLRLAGNTAIEAADGKLIRYEPYMAWFKENLPYIYFTGEGFHKTSEPVPCAVNLNAKYLCRAISPHDGKMADPLTDAENSSLAAFRQMGVGIREELAQYSHRLHGSNINQWASWLKMPVDKQVEAARNGLGGKP